MKVTHLLEYTEDSEIDPLSDDHIAEIKNNCSQFINEFMQNGIMLYRGLDDIDAEHSHLIPTQAQRTVHGSTFDSALVRHSFENFLSRYNVSRYSNSVSAISFDPIWFKGVGVHAWFIFIPVNGYGYHYFTNVDSGDINVTSTNDFSTLSSYGVILESILGIWSSLRENVKHMSDENITSVFSPYKKPAIDRFFERMEYIITRMKDPFNNDIHGGIEEQKLSLESFVRSSDLFLRNIDMVNDINHILEDTHAIISHMYKIDNIKAFDAIQNIIDSIKINELPPKDNKYELVFTCQKYYAFPLHLKDELLKRVLK
jgi:hypothetical protein